VKAGGVELTEGTPFERVERFSALSLRFRSRGREGGGKERIRSRRNEPDGKRKRRRRDGFPSSWSTEVTTRVRSENITQKPALLPIFLLPKLF
jgi:hypothetical protein